LIFICALFFIFPQTNVVDFISIFADGIAVFDEPTANGADPQDSTFLAGPLPDEKVGQKQQFPELIINHSSIGVSRRITQKRQKSRP
jgi:hypothetical protein